MGPLEGGPYRQHAGERPAQWGKLEPFVNRNI